MALRKRTYRKKSMKKRNLGKKTRKCKKCCACCKCKCRKCGSKKRVTRRKKQRGGSQIAYYKYNNQTPAPRDLLTSSRIHGCAGGSKKKSRKVRKGGRSQGSTLLPQHLVNVGRGFGHSLNGIKSGFLGVDSNASPYPTQDQPIDHKLTGAFTYSPTNIRNIRMGAERSVGKL